ncbi:cob(I)yrinic acid a,c-diamide adenosyltransferase [Roseimarinus sediminis]|uniref:cob(I)yrinic acid a,c-diamide adenosyltransferase n=1 Tax=Roseimarinus sediminis TaxID=1610899 RepID=UPI003D1C7D78
MKIYTKTGDDGTSGLIGGTRVEKSDARLEAYGTVDELNSWIGLLLTAVHDQLVTTTLELIQNKLFVIGSHLATDTKSPNAIQRMLCKPDDINMLENELDRMQEQLPELRNFILPGGAVAAAQCQIARTVCRRAERRITSIKTMAEVDEEVIIFINRLSDYLFVLARYINHQQGISETKWTSAKT